MFKKTDVKSAVAMLITGFIAESEPEDKTLLRQALDAISEEVEDWEENFNEARYDEKLNGAVFQGKAVEVGSTQPRRGEHYGGGQSYKFCGALEPSP